MPFKVLQIGLGRFGQAHLKGWRALGVDLLVCDEAEAALEAARPFALKAAARFEDLLSEADAVDVVTPASTHFEIVSACLEAGKDVLCEKPLADTSERAYRLAERAASIGRILQTGHVFRFEPCAVITRDLLRAGRIGAPRCVRARFSGFKRPRSDGGVAISDAIHMIDLVSALLGKQPQRVTATVDDFLGRGMDDCAWIALDYGAERAHVEASLFAPERARDLVVMGERGAIACDFLAPARKVRVFDQTHARQGAHWVAVEGSSVAIDVGDEEPLRRELADFMRCVETRELPRACGMAGAHAVAVIEAALLSARARRTIEVDLRVPAHTDA